MKTTQKTKKKAFDCVKMKEELQKAVQAKIAGKSPEEIIAFFNSYGAPPRGKRRQKRA